MSEEPRLPEIRESRDRSEATHIKSVLSPKTSRYAAANRSKMEVAIRNDNSDILRHIMTPNPQEIKREEVIRQSLAAATANRDSVRNLRHNMQALNQNMHILERN